MGTPGPSTRDQIRARDGDRCWLCNGKLSFDPRAKEKRRPSIEHLEPTSLGGGNNLDNLRLCHPGCNQQLGNRPRAEKEGIREKRQRAIVENREKMAKAAQAPAKSKVKAATAAPQGKSAPSVSPALPSYPMAVLAKASVQKAQVSDWHRIAFLATATATFFAGLSLGMLIG